MAALCDRVLRALQWPRQAGGAGEGGAVDCDEFVEFVTDFLDDALPEADEAGFIEHLTVCDGCQTYLEQFRQTIDTLGELPTKSISGEARDKLLTAFRGFRRVG
jgi:hypothetical protein